MNMRLSQQKGMSLMEVLVAMSISLVVTASMIALMANSLGSTARIVNMTKLSDDLRTTMQMMTRDVRRSSYNANSMFCYANTNCRSAVDATVAGDIPINGGNDCFTFLTDRDHDGDSTENDAGGFRRVISSGVGVIEMWTGNAAPDCSVAAGTAGWVQITNPEIMDIFVFSVDDDLSYTQVVLDDGLGNILTEKVRKIRMNMRGRLVVDNTIVRRIEDVISVRNDLLF
ncbi:MAG: PilW family protein [Lysobacterales bacterium]